MLVNMSSLEACVSNARVAICAKYELDQEVIDDIMAIVSESFSGLTSGATVTVSENKVKRVRKPRAPEATPRFKSGYNFYISEQFKVKKASAEPYDSQELMAELSRQWTSLTKEEKQPYQEMAAKAKAEALSENPPNESDETKPDETETTTKKPRKPRATKEEVGETETKTKKLTGYNLFYRESKDTLRENMTEGSTMGQAAGVAWKALTEEERTGYNARAKELGSA